MSLTLQIVSIYHHIGRRQITLFSALFQIPSHSLKSSRASLFFHSRENRSVPKFSFIVIYFIARSSHDSILATDGNNLKRAHNPLVSCFVSFSRDNSQGWKDRYRYQQIFLREIIILDILISSKKVSVLRDIYWIRTRRVGTKVRTKGVRNVRKGVTKENVCTERVYKI